MTDDPTVLVLREGVHGMPVEEYATALRERLDCEVRLARTPAEERDLAADATVVTGPRMDEGLLAAADSLELFAGAYAGHSHLPLEAFEERGVAVTNASGVHAPNVAEHVVGAILAFSRNFHVGRERASRGEWRSYPTGELQGSTVAVVGLGAIGSAVVDRLNPFGVRSVGVRGDPSNGGPADEVVGPDRFHDAIAEAAYVVLACPLTDATRGLVDREAFRTMRDDGVLVNVARGQVVDTDALVEALRRNAVGGAALDVTDPEPLPPDHPLWGFGNVLVTPHNAGATPRYYDRLADLVAGNVTRLGSGGPLANRVV
ncbi:D-2-hydroxyacid dehydrogenase [Salinirubellus salinus]|uniref:D-2-hydroxyacid dehydrogenase n=1 Tax=Salinirubellus salinus TaxID=1364945 RepID=A0A9E7R7S2_9EURY|nr:D-2-hydroxyacid dehydrogenase [Salinirubellus salinus]UWM56230.1 D-2-hydroxyacid dehydrogenase [Salinirubellus salinus]